jgi:hypothetical protein
VLQSAIVVNSPLAFFRHLLADRFGSPLAGDEAGPAMVGAMEFCRARFASAVGLADWLLAGEREPGRMRL